MAREWHRRELNLGPNLAAGKPVTGRSWRTDTMQRPVIGLPEDDDEFLGATALENEDAGSSEEILYYLGSYLGGPEAPVDPKVLRVAACPGFMRAAPGLAGVCQSIRPGPG